MKENLLVLTILNALFLLTATVSFAESTERVSISSEGREGNAGSSYPNLSADGRYVVFVSSADNLVDGDVNGASDAFIRDRVTGMTERVATRIAFSSWGTVGPAISGEGRYVAFLSYEDDLVPGDGNGLSDVFVYDRSTGVTERVTGDINSLTPPAISADGRFVAYSHGILHVYDRMTGIDEIASISSSGGVSGASYYPSLSADGCYVVFLSWADNLVPGDTRWTWDVFVRDRAAGTTERITNGGDGTFFNHWGDPPAISADGRYVAYSTYDANVVPGDANGARDVFVFDRFTGATSRVSVDSDGNEGNGMSDRPAISADGRYVAYRSYATNLVPGDMNGKSDIFIHDRQTGKTKRVSVDSNENEANSSSGFQSSVSGNGRYVAFSSSADNLVSDDTNNAGDVFVRDRGSSAPRTPRDLIDLIRQILEAGQIDNEGIAGSLIATLKGVQGALDRGSQEAAENALQAFLNKVDAQAGKHISDEAAGLLTEAASLIMQDMQVRQPADR